MGEAASRVSGADIDRMTDRFYVEGRRKQSACWVLLTLAAVIAVADSDATVIGAMIVALVFGGARELPAGG